MPQARERDPEQTRLRLQGWLAERLPDARALRVSDMHGPESTGFSSDTLLFDLVWSEAGRARSEALVLRLAPTGFRVFPDYDIARQFRVLETLGPTAVPVPEVRWLEEEDAVLGAPFYVMRRVEGRIPTDTPPYHVGGWVPALRPEERAALWWSGIETLARIHALDFEALGLRGFGEGGDAGGTHLERELRYYADFLAWTREGAPHPVCDAALVWLERERPKGREPEALCWGDARLANMIFRELRCVAVLDWEMVGLGNPVKDLAWWIALDRCLSEGIGAPRLPGFPGREETVARWEEHTGRSAEHLPYYEVFAAFRFAVIMARIAKQMQHYGVLPPDSSFDVDNMATRVLAKRLDLPGPGEAVPR